MAAVFQIEVLMEQVLVHIQYYKQFEVLLSFLFVSLFVKDKNTCEFQQVLECNLG